VTFSAGYSGSTARRCFKREPGRACLPGGNRRHTESTASGYGPLVCSTRKGPFPAGQLRPSSPERDFDHRMRDRLIPGVGNRSVRVGNRRAHEVFRALHLSPKAWTSRRKGGLAGGFCPVREVRKRMTTIPTTTAIAIPMARPLVSRSFGSERRLDRSAMGGCCTIRGEQGSSAEDTAKTRRNTGGTGLPR